MCGIAGYFGTNQLDEGRIDTCLGLMGRRGPDHAAHRRWRTPGGTNAYLLHTRLNIIDLNARSDQPFQVGSKWMAYNGELYNFMELRDEAEREGHRFATTSDTEVLLAGIHHHGWSALDSFEGMWAFAVYDETDGSLTLSRDRFGEKPLYLYRDTTGLYFGSEPKFITALMGRRLGVNRDQVLRYLINGYKSLYKEGHTFFQGLTEVPAGTVLHLDANGREESHAYWSPSFDQDDDMSYEEAVAGVRENLLRSVEMRLRADVPLAFCMSGGVDSNSLISIARREFDYDVHGFTIHIADERYDERDLVEYSAGELGVHQTYIPSATDGFLPNLRTLVRYHDAPVYTINFYSHWQLMESVAAQGYRVSVMGTGGDELLAGYYDHQLFYLEAVQHDAGVFAKAKDAWSTHVRPIVQNPYLSDPERFIRDPGFRDHIFLDAAGFSEYLTEPWAESFAECHFVENLLRNRMLNETFHETIPPILHEDDLNAMYYSVENRSPMLDRGLFEHCLRIPVRHLVQDGMSKAVLRDAMRGLVPDGILDFRRKIGFNAPILTYLDVNDPGVREELLRDGPIFDLVRRERIEELMAKPHMPNSESKFLFSFVSAKMFLEEFEE
jgi:asparagine synthase (glutamine-hydrolysing)